MWTQNLFSSYGLWLLVSLFLLQDWKGQPQEGRDVEKTWALADIIELPVVGHWSPPSLEFWICRIMNFSQSLSHLVRFSIICIRNHFEWYREFSGYKGVFVLEGGFLARGTVGCSIMSLSYLLGLSLPVSLLTCSGWSWSTWWGLNTSSWEGMENDPDQTVNSEFLFGAFNLHWNGKVVIYWFIFNQLMFYSFSS